MTKVTLVLSHGCCKADDGAATQDAVKTPSVALSLTRGANKDKCKARSVLTTVMKDGETISFIK